MLDMLIFALVYAALIRRSPTTLAAQFGNAAGSAQHRGRKGFSAYSNGHITRN